MNKEFLSFKELNAQETLVPKVIELIPVGDIVTGRDGRYFNNKNPQFVIDKFNDDPKDIPIDINHATEFRFGDSPVWMD